MHGREAIQVQIGQVCSKSESPPLLHMSKHEGVVENEDRGATDTQHDYDEKM